ncbi:RidA family protein [Micromonospora echinospora]
MVAAVAGGLGRVASVVRMVVYVASDPSFTGQPKVADGASELLDLAFGSRGRHARSAMGVAVLPLDAPVEVELVVELLPRHAARDE